LGTIAGESIGFLDTDATVVAQVRPAEDYLDAAIWARKFRWTITCEAVNTIGARTTILTRVLIAFIYFCTAKSTSEPRCTLAHKVDTITHVNAG